MTAPKVTPWIKGDPLPDRPGWYDLRYSRKKVLRVWWDGRRYRRSRSAEWPMLAGSAYGMQDQHRGLTAPAKA